MINVKVHGYPLFEFITFLLDDQSRFYEPLQENQAEIIGDAIEDVRDGSDRFHGVSATKTLIEAIDKANTIVRYDSLEFTAEIRRESGSGSRSFNDSRDR